MADAASEAENFVFSPISLALSRSAWRSSPVAPETAATCAIAESKSAAVFTAAVPRPITASEAGMTLLPTPVILSPTASNLPPTSSILARVALVVTASSCRRRSSCSVSMISLCRASYLSCPRSPFSSCSFACRCASLSVFSFSEVAPMASLRSFCFWARSCVLEGSSFSRRSTSFSSDCVVFIVEFTCFRAFSSPVVSPPISIVMPFILLAMTSHLLVMGKIMHSSKMMSALF